MSCFRSSLDSATVTPSMIALADYYRVVCIEGYFHDITLT